MRELSMTARAIRMRERRRKMKIEGIESQPRNDCLCSLREVAKYWGVSTARAAQIERLALSKMRAALAEVWEDYCDRQQSIGRSNTGRTIRAVPQSDVGHHAEGYAREVDGVGEGSD